MAVALVALAVFFVHESRPASAEHGGVTILSADLTVAFSGFGCNSQSTGSECSSALNDDDFTHGGVAYEIVKLTSGGSTIDLRLNKTIPANLKSDLTLYLDAMPFAAADAVSSTLTNANDTLRWSITTAPSWSVGQKVDVWLRVPAFTGVELFGGDLDASDSHSAPTLSVAEGGSATFMVKLSEQPIANVTVSIGKGTVSCAGCGGNWHDDVSAGTVSPTTLTFNFSNWDAGQTVTVTGVADDDSVHEHFLALVYVSSTASTDPDDPFFSPEASEGVYVTVTDGSDDGSQHGGL
ncbi:MAG: hypothetical protein OXE45_00445 [bacterium]|nr:hypothetical protein [bacterium]